MLERKQVEGKTAIGRPPSALMAALRRLLRPLVRALIHQHVQYPQLARLLKSLYVDIAKREFAIDGEEVTLSRLSLLTGIHRREAKRVSEESKTPDAPAPSAVSLGTQVLARWTGEAPWVDAEGRPRPLPWADESGIDFRALVRSVSVDIHARSVLDDWLRLGVAVQDTRDRVVLRTAAFVPTKGFDEKAHFVGRNLRDHISAGFENLAADEAPHFERAVYYADLPDSAIVELDALAREVSQEALERVNARARDLARSAGKSPTKGGGRPFTFGAYIYKPFDWGSQARGRGSKSDV